jgi:hypothetical protein
MAFQRREDGDEADHRGQHDQQQADAVDADQILRAQAGYPVGALDELKAGHAFVEARNQRQRNQETGEAGQVRPDLDQFFWRDGMNSRTNSPPAA